MSDQACSMNEWISAGKQSVLKCFDPTTVECCPNVDSTGNQEVRNSYVLCDGCE